MKTQSTATRCCASTAVGTPCRRWAVRGSNPPRCAVHADAPPTEADSFRNGLYSRAFFPEEETLIHAVRQAMALESELILVRVTLNRLLAYFNQEPPLTIREATRLAETLFHGAGLALRLAQISGKRAGRVDWEQVLADLEAVEGAEFRPPGS